MYVDIKYNNMLVCATVLVVYQRQHNMAKVVSLLLMRRMGRGGRRRGRRHRRWRRRQTVFRIHAFHMYVYGCMRVLVVLDAIFSAVIIHVVSAYHHQHTHISYAHTHARNAGMMMGRVVMSVLNNS